jgi:hypothetical protein
VQAPAWRSVRRQCSGPPNQRWALCGNRHDRWERSCRAAILVRCALEHVQRDWNRCQIAAGMVAWETWLDDTRGTEARLRQPLGPFDGGNRAAPKSPLVIQGVLDYMGTMTHPTPRPEAASVEVPAFEAGGNVLALLPREALERLGHRAGRGRDRPHGADFKIVVVGENRDFSVLAAEIKGAWLLHGASGGQPGQVARHQSLDHVITYLVAAALGTDQPLPPGGPAVAALITRFGRALSRVAITAGEDLIHKALERSTDIGALVELLRSSVPLLSAEQEIDPRLAKNIASLEAEEELLGRAGGLRDAKWVAEYLSINPKSVAAKARRNELLAIPRGDRNLYPAFQFRDGQVVPGVREILEVLPLTNGWSRLSYLLTPDPGLDDRTPIEAFRTEPEATLALARGADTQGAA